MGAARAQLTPEEIAQELHRIRAAVIVAKLRDFPAIPRAELENAYGDVSVDALKRSFGGVPELTQFVHEALRHDALDLAKSAAFRNTSSLDGMIASPESLEHNVLRNEARQLLHEFLAELSEDDRKIAYLHFDPDYDWTPRRIAAALALPRTEVKLTLDRVGIRFRRFAALAVAPGALCSHRRPELVEWQRTGVMPLVLRLHLRRCRRCRAEQREAILAMRSAMLPLIPVAAMPATATGALARLYRTIGAHPAAVRSNDAIARVRKVAPVGGGGGAALAAKLAAATAVVTAGAALHVATATSSPKHHHQLTRHARVVHAAIDDPHAAASPKPPPAATDQPTPAPISAPASQSVTTHAFEQPTVTTSQPPPAPDQDTAAPAPSPVSTPARSAIRAADDSGSDSPPAPTSIAGSTSGGDASSASSDTQNGPASPSGPPPP